MDLHLTLEQTLLRDSAAKFIEAAGPKVARGFREQDPSFAPARLRHAGELVWLGILVPPSADGLGLGLTELALVLQQAGRGLVCEPIGLAAIAAAALAQGSTPHPMLAPTAAGSRPSRSRTRPPTFSRRTHPRAAPWRRCTTCCCSRSRRNFWA